jgi:alkylated DNA repair dioxygenase AlkB
MSRVCTRTAVRSNGLALGPRQSQRRRAKKVELCQRPPGWVSASVCRASLMAKRAAGGRMKESDDVSRCGAGRQKRRQSPDREIAATASQPQRIQSGRKRVPSDRRTLDLFEDHSLPQGFKYQSDFLSREEEHSLLQHIKNLPFREFEFHGFTGKRRVVSFGWRYDFNGGGLTKTEDMPEFLSGARARAENFAAIGSRDLQQVLITEYSPGAAIGWHKDRSVFGDVVGISLLSPCTFRLRLKAGGRWERRNFTAEPRSVYLLRGPSRTEWEHSIPGVDSLRYSLTFRNVLEGTAEHGPNLDFTEASSADARYADRRPVR